MSTVALIVPRGTPSCVLRRDEYLVPKPRLEMAFQLWQVEVGAAAARDEFLRVVEKIQCEVEDPAGDRRTIDQHVLLGQMPPARTHEERRELVTELVRLAFGADEVDLAANRVAQVDLALDVVVPLRRVGVLEVGHEHVGAGVERVDDHLAIDRPGNLDTAVLNIGRNRRANPIALAYDVRFGQEVRQLAGVEIPLPLRALCEQFGAPPAEGALQARSKVDGLRRQDRGIFRGDAALDFNARAVSCGAHGRSLSPSGVNSNGGRCVSSAPARVTAKEAQNTRTRGRSPPDAWFEAFCCSASIIAE